MEFLRGEELNEINILTKLGQMLFGKKPKSPMEIEFAMLSHIHGEDPDQWPPMERYNFMRKWGSTLAQANPDKQTSIDANIEKGGPTYGKYQGGGQLSNRLG